MPALRERYVEHLAACSHPGSHVAHQPGVPAESDGGPPFSVTRDEIMRLYSPNFVSRKSRARTSWRTRLGCDRAGLTELLEVCYLLVRR